MPRLVEFNKDIKFDFLIENQGINKIIHYEIPETFDENLKECSSCKFILTELILGGETLKISFITDKYNYAMSKNLITKQFIKYFTNKHYIHKVFHEIFFTDLSNLHLYELKIMDANVNLVTLTSEDSFVFTKDSYEVFVNANKPAFTVPPLQMPEEVNFEYEKQSDDDIWPIPEISRVTTVNNQEGKPKKPERKRRKSFAFE
jgi:hypothetical protein